MVFLFCGKKEPKQAQKVVAGVMRLIRIIET
jgi:hypothetical protein